MPGHPGDDIPVGTLKGDPPVRCSAEPAMSLKYAVIFEPAPESLRELGYRIRARGLA